jgi:predicted XRE-type DNA-binding protein
MNKTNGRIRVEQGSGNVFRDLGFPHPEREQLKADLTLQIYRLIKQRGLTQAEAGEILGIRQPRLSALMRGRSGAFSVERLMYFLRVGAGASKEGGLGKDSTGRAASWPDCRNR